MWATRIQYGDKDNDDDGNVWSTIMIEIRGIPMALPPATSATKPRTAGRGRGGMILEYLPGSNPGGKRREIFLTAHSTLPPRFLPLASLP